MAFFTSEYECKLDAKGRLVLPSKIKANLPDVSSSELYIMKGFDANLVMYTAVEFEKVNQKIAKLSDYDTDQRKFKTTFYRGTTQVDLDNTGRFLIPKSWIEHAKLEKKVVVVGAGKTIEIWSPKVYDDFLIKDTEEYSYLAKKFLHE